MCLIDVLAVVIIVSSWLHARVLNEASVVGELELTALSRSETAFRSVVNIDWVLLCEEGCGDASIGLRHAVFVYHATHVTSVAWHLLSAHVVRRTGNPIDRMFGVVAEDVSVDLGVRW